MSRRTRPRVTKPGGRVRAVSHADKSQQWSRKHTGGGQEAHEGGTPPTPHSAFQAGGPGGARMRAAALPSLVEQGAQPCGGVPTAPWERAISAPGTEDKRADAHAKGMRGTEVPAPAHGVLLTRSVFSPTCLQVPSAGAPRQSRHLHICPRPPPLLRPHRFSAEDHKSLLLSLSRIHSFMIKMLNQITSATQNAATASHQSGG